MSNVARPWLAVVALFSLVTASACATDAGEAFDDEAADDELGVIYSAGNCDLGGVEVYENAAWDLRDKRDVWFSFCVGQHPILPGWNDRITDLKVFGDLDVVVWEHENFGGQHRLLDAWREQRFTLGSDWNDRISSIQIFVR